MRLPVFDKNGKRTQEILEFDEKILGEKVREVLLKEAVLMYEARKRVGTHSTKGRAECSGSGRKLSRQKGTGRARVGPARPPHWRGGGVVFGPKPRDYSYAMPKKARRAATSSAWLAKFIDREVMVVEEFDFSEPKTSKLAKILSTMGLEGTSTAIAIDGKDDNLLRSSSNIPKVSLEALERFNAYVLLSHNNIVISKQAFEKLVSSKGGEIKSLKRQELYGKK